MPVHDRHVGLRRRRSEDAVQREQHRRHRRRRRTGVPRRLGAPDQLSPLGAGVRFADSAQSECSCNGDDSPDDCWIEQSPRTTIRSTCFGAIRLAFRLVPLIYSAGRDEALGILRCSGCRHVGDMPRSQIAQRRQRRNPNGPFHQLADSNSIHTKSVHRRSPKHTLARRSTARRRTTSTIT